MAADVCKILITTTLISFPFLRKRSVCLLPFPEYNFNSFQSRKMSMTTVNVFSVVTSNECFIICVGNAFTIFVFWNQCSGSLRRTCYLLLNPVVVNLLVGVVGPIVFVTRSIPFLLGTPGYDKMDVGYYFSIFVVVFQSFLSLSFHWNVLSQFCARLFTEPQALDFTSTVSLLLGPLE